MFLSNRNPWRTLTRLVVGCALVGPALALEFPDVAREGELRFLAKLPDPGACWYQSNVTIEEVIGRVIESEIKERGEAR